MAEMERLDHSGIPAPNLDASQWFYECVLGVSPASHSGQDSGSAPQARSIHSDVMVGGLGLALMLPNDRIRMPAEDELVASNGFRHGFCVSRERFGAVIERLTEYAIPFRGPVVHPEAGPLGESVYFKDPGGNFMEVCWRRGEQPT